MPHTVDSHIANRPTMHSAPELTSGKTSKQHLSKTTLPGPRVPLDHAPQGPLSNTRPQYPSLLWPRAPQTRPVSTKPHSTHSTHLQHPRQVQTYMETPKQLQTWPYYPLLHSNCQEPHRAILCDSPTCFTCQRPPSLTLRSSSHTTWPNINAKISASTHERRTPSPPHNHGGECGNVGCGNGLNLLPTSPHRLLQPTTSDEPHPATTTTTTDDSDDYIPELMSLVDAQTTLATTEANIRNNTTHWSILNCRR